MNQDVLISIFLIFFACITDQNGYLYLALDYEYYIYISGLSPPELKDDEIPVLTLSNSAGSSKDFPINHKMNLEKVLDVPDMSSKRY